MRCQKTPALWGRCKQVEKAEPLSIWLTLPVYAQMAEQL